SLGLSSLDPAFNTIKAGITSAANLTTAQSDFEAMYGWLNGRVPSASSSYPVNRATGTYPGPGTYNLDEAEMGAGLYAQDSWRVRSGLTFNYGRRFYFIRPTHDFKQGYTSPPAADVFGSSGYMNIFQPGANSGPANPQFTTSGDKYNSSYFLPQPQIGFAWNPNFSDGFWGRVLGGGKTVFRGSYTLKNYTAGGQSFWQAGSNPG